MDQEVMDFFDFSKEFKREVAPQGSISNPNKKAVESTESKAVKRDVIGTEYVHKIVAKEKHRLNRTLRDECPESKRNRSNDDLDSDDEGEEFNIRPDEEYYKKYTFNLNRDKNLPIYAKREEILAAVKAHPVVILKGETGCGKTTQVPQYILDEAVKSGQYCNIVVTQPRRIAAISMANRVCQERQWQPDTVCSYQVGLHRPATLEDTRLLYCTTGVLLNNLIHNKTLTHYTHIVLDEVHERDQDMDFLLIVVRRLLATNSRHVKIILMSATIDAKELCDYFTTKNSIPPVIAASYGRKYSIEKFYRDHLGSIMWKQEDEDQYIPRITDEGYRAAVKILLVIDNMERECANQSQQSYDEAKRHGAVLVFLPGVFEIDNMEEHITSILQNDQNIKVFVVRCFSLMTPENQRDVFRSPPNGFRKIILTTNIAESSITVPDVSYVIDFCLTKVLITDTATNFSSLRLSWASRANCRQRAGRVGRLRSGRVYRMVNKSFYQRVMSEFGVPEMLRQPLHMSVLRAKELEMDSPVDLLALALSPPNLEDIQNTILLLKEVGALFPTVDGVYNVLDGDITYWGTIMSRLPLDTYLSRFIILGYVFNLLEEVIIIAAGLSMRGLYVNECGRQKGSDSFWMHYIFADGSGSDLLAIWRVYLTYLNMVEDGQVQESAIRWAKRFHVSLRSLKEMHLLVQELRVRCKKLGLMPFSIDPSQKLSDNQKVIILKVIIAGAFYPNYFMRSKGSNEEPGRDMYQVISGHDPCRTVYFTNFKPGYMGELYTRQIKDLFSEAKISSENIDVTFQHGSQKVFVTFKDDDCNTNISSFINVSGRIKSEVYKAVRMRLDRMQRPIRIMEQNKFFDYVKQQKIGDIIDGCWIPPARTLNVELLALPSVYDKTITGLITCIVNCGKFYFQPQSFAECIRNMSEIFNVPQHLRRRVFNAEVIGKGMMLLAKRNNHFQRATVIRPENQNSRKSRFYVRYIDYGDIAVLPMELLRLMPEELFGQFFDLPPRVFECRLALVQPSIVVSTNNRWHAAANDMLNSMANLGRIDIDVYSLLNNVAAVFIRTSEGLLNDKLVELKLARRADEDFMSRQDHDFRLRKQESARYSTSAERQQVNEEYLRSCQLPQDLDLPPPPLDKCNTIVMLKGPYSPLESAMHSTTRVGLLKSVKIDSASVNAVLLDADPQDHHDQMIVAHATVESPDGHILNARGTTLMPNIHGFGALMVMLFCPTMQLKCNKYGSKYVSILAGLGFDPETNESYFEEHDMVINLDVNILEDDVILINQMRYLIDRFFFNFKDENSPAVSANERVSIYTQLISLTIWLLSKDRSYIEQNASNSDYVWEKSDMLSKQPEPFGKRAIFPMHTVPELVEEDFDQLMQLVENCKKLYEWRTFEGTLIPMTCKLCNQLLESVSQLRMHLLTQQHRDREKQIDYQKKHNHNII
ncbi:probable ATP-dependent RNA helicase spindle-E [Drosophila eugracilis]|uniref:probable ATP-dependent RNA helicase spindle-E n=1 Tax=Drosophila eugracilis TaxID=29029 RepID=UPI001BDA15D8|nr:probable ATP-dependent RNA helicase spindle-E [Drosophila eugracilis]